MSAPLPLMGIATPTRCSCGAFVSVGYGSCYPGHRFEALCHDCYDGTEDAGAAAHVRGFGDTIDAALWAWQDKHDEAHGVEWVLADLFGDLARQMSEERERQRGWLSTYVPSDGAIYYAPEVCP